MGTLSPEDITAIGTSIAQALGSSLVPALVEAMRRNKERLHTQMCDSKAFGRLPSFAKGQGSWRTRALSNRASATRARVDDGTLKLIQVASEAQLADGLTKSFSGPNMQKVRKQLNMAIYQGMDVARSRRAAIISAIS